jgi:hypothetical protein
MLSAIRYMLYTHHISHFVCLSSPRIIATVVLISYIAGSVQALLASVAARYYICVKFEKC